MASVAAAMLIHPVACGRPCMPDASGFEGRHDTFRRPFERHRRSGSAVPDRLAGALSRRLLIPDLAAGGGSGHGSVAGAGQENRVGLPAGDRAGDVRDILVLPSGSQSRPPDPRDLSRRLVLVLVARLAGQGPIIIGLDDTIEAPLGRAYQGARHLSRPGAFQPWPFRQDQRAALAQLHAACPAALVAGHQGPALPDHPGPVRTLRRQARPASQATHRLGATGHASNPSLGPQRAIVFVADSSFGNHELAWRIGQRATLISRLRLDANLFAPPPPRDPNKRGRPRQKGPPLPKLQTRLDDPDARWTSITLPRWYGSSKEKTLQIISDTALWYRPGTPPKAIRWVLVRDPEGERDPQAFFCPDTNMEPAKIIATFVRRWQVEVTFQELRAHLGLETQRQWSHAAIARTTPVLCGLYSLVCLWATDVLSTNHLSYAAAWYQKTSVTFSDAIAAIRCQTLAWKQFIALPATPGTKHNSARQDKADAVRPLLRSIMHKVEIRKRFSKSLQEPYASGATQQKRQAIRQTYGVP